MRAGLYALLAAVFYAINIPASKVLLRDVGPTTMDALLYLGAARREMSRFRFKALL